EVGQGIIRIGSGQNGAHIVRRRQAVRREQVVETVVVVTVAGGKINHRDAERGDGGQQRIVGTYLKRNSVAGSHTEPTHDSAAIGKIIGSGLKICGDRVNPAGRHYFVRIP